MENKYNFKVGDYVAYVPPYLLKDWNNGEVSDDCLGIIRKITIDYIFVKYNNSLTSKATPAHLLRNVNSHPEFSKRIVASNMLNNSSNEKL
jgi:hypothetical protein